MEWLKIKILDVYLGFWIPYIALFVFLIFKLKPWKEGGDDCGETCS